MYDYLSLKYLLLTSFVLFSPNTLNNDVYKSSNFNLKLGKNGKNDVKILDNVYGEVPKRQITAIMGPSGAGKTSLLNILAGRTRTNNSLKVHTDVRLNNFSVDPTKMDVRKQIAFVAQDDSLNPTATPREAIRFSAKMRLPNDTTEVELDTLVRSFFCVTDLIHYKIYVCFILIN